MSSVKNFSIQSLRAIAAMMVFLSHSLMMIKSNSISRLHDTPLHFLFDGQCAVVFFMVLSGYLYYKVEPFSMKKYMMTLWKKVVRIYPAHIIMIGVGVLLCNLQLPYHTELFSEWGNSFWGQPIGMLETIRQMIIVIPGTDPYLVNPPVWYLQVEVRMFFLMPIIIGLLNKLGESKDTVAFWTTFIVLCCISCIVYPFAACYLVGYLAAHIQNIHLTFKFRKLPSLLTIGGGILSIVLININNELYITHYWLSLIIQSLGAAGIIVMCFAKPVLLSFRWLAKLGDYSYEFYLVHFVVLLSCKSLVDNLVVFCFLSFVVSVPLAIVVRGIQVFVREKLVQ